MFWRWACLSANFGVGTFFLPEKHKPASPLQKHLKFINKPHLWGAKPLLLLTHEKAFKFWSKTSLESCVVKKIRFLTEMCRPQKLPASRATTIPATRPRINNITKTMKCYSTTSTTSTRTTRTVSTTWTSSTTTTTTNTTTTTLKWFFAQNCESFFVPQKQKRLRGPKVRFIHKFKVLLQRWSGLCFVA